MEILDYQEAGKLVVQIEGRVDATSADRAESLLVGAVEKANSDVVVHLSGVSFMSSAGLRALLTAGKKAKAEGFQLLIAEPSEQVAELLSLSGFDTLFPVKASLTEALK